jgi:hypothetical protein
VGAGEVFGRVGDEHGAATRELAHHGVVLGCTDVAGREHRAVLGDQRQDVMRRG